MATTNTKQPVLSLLTYAITLLALLSPGLNSSAMQRDSALVTTTMKHGLNDAGSYITSPLRWDGNDWLIAGGVTAVTGALIAWGDEQVYQMSNNIQSPGLDLFSKAAEPMGNYYPAIAIVAALTHGLVKKNNYSVETSLIAAESMFFSVVAVQTVKTVAGRKRPNPWGTTNPHEWDGPFFNGNSFFSGHTVTAFSVASVFAYRYRDTPWVPFVSYGLATLGGFQRIFQSRHWASDVFMGAAIGTATGIFLSKQWEKNSIRFYPAISTTGAGFSMVIPIW